MGIIRCNTKNREEWEETLAGYKLKIVCLVLRIFTFVYIATIVFIHIHQYRSGLPIIKDLVFYSITVIFLLFLIMGMKRHPKQIINLFVLLILFILVYIDFFCDRNFSLDYVSPIFYLLSTAITIFLIEAPVSIIFSVLFVAIFFIRTLYLSKLPFLEDIILLVMTGLSVFVMGLFKVWLMNSINHKIQTLTDLNSVTTNILGKVVELRDGETSNHLLRVKTLVKEIASDLNEIPEYRNYLSLEYRRDLEKASALHDIGKIGIPDKILLKPAKLTSDEFEIMKTHSAIGFELLKEAGEKLHDKNFYELAIEIARHHHEKWDGSGYPDGLKEKEIPLSARIMAVADVYDALTSRRSYKSAFSHEKSIEIIESGRGTSFDPDIVDILIKSQHRIKEIMKKL